MQTVPTQLITIVAESVLTDRLARALLAAGATGYTASAATGVGSAEREASTVGGENTRIEALVAPEVAARVLGMLARDWFPHYAVVAWVSTVQVLRGDKFTTTVSR